MTGDLTREPTESGFTEGCVGLLKTLQREEILEVLSDGICQHCLSLMETRIHNLLNRKLGNISLSNASIEASSSEYLSLDVSGLSPVHNKTFHLQESPVNSKQHSFKHSDSEILLNDGLSGGSSNGLPEDGKERMRFSQVGRKKDFVHIERIDGKETNVLQGLELYNKVFNTEEQKKIVQFVYNLQRMGQKGLLRERTYSEPRKWMRGKGRVTLQFGCCYNYAVDKNGNPPGIIRNEEVDPLPPMFKQMIKRMVRWHILPPTCIPNSCIVNIYDEGDCIPPHIDHHDFLRPFCTVSFLTESKILFGSNLKIVGPGEFAGPVSIPLPVGSVLILSGNGADVAKHCVPAVSAKRISITFRKMNDRKLPYNFSPDPELLGTKPIVYSPSNKSPIQQNRHQKPPPVYYSPPAKSSFWQNQHQNNRLPSADRPNTNSFTGENNDFPPLGSSNSWNQVTFTRAESRQ